MKNVFTNAKAGDFSSYQGIETTRSRQTISWLLYSRIVTIDGQISRTDKARS